MSKFKEETLHSEDIYQGRILNLKVDRVKLPDGRKSTREIVEHSGGVAVVPVTENNEIILVKQFRKPVEDVILEIPAGKLEDGEETLDCARRELGEETGYVAEKLRKLVSFYTSPGYSDEVIHLYLGRDLKYTATNPDPEEFIEITKIKKEKIIDLITNGEIQDSKTVIGLLTYLRVEENE